jgi:GH15 family glucan-1,4-alpha-glucosidase
MYLPITDHGLIGDLHTAALVGVDGRMAWLPWPRFDSPSVFAALLDYERGGDWLLAPADATSSQQHYDGLTAILVTEFETPTGRAELLDWMTPWDGEAPDHDVCRVLRCTEGEIEVVGRLAPRPDYARQSVALQPRGNGVQFDAHGIETHLLSNQPWKIDGDVATLHTTLRAGDAVQCVLYSGQEVLLEDIWASLDRARRFWIDWISACAFPGQRWSDIVDRSAITLKLLTYAPSGAIIAAPTTSLPESIGGVRNWDYRYTWLRDASFTLYAMYRLGFDSEARAFFGWLGERCFSCDPPLQIMYGIDGEEELTEKELEHLEGYRGSRPVRIGNGAYDQRHLDVYGGVVDAAYLYEQRGELFTPEQWTTLQAEIDYVCEHWAEPDQGIWEMRGPAQQHVFSKVMCWLTLDRGIKLAELEGWQYDQERWMATRDAIRESILTHGWNPERRAFTISYESDELDASLLVMPLIKFLPATDERVLATIERIQEELCDGALVYRYRFDDGLPEGEGAFLLCSFWMVDALTLAGRIDEAVERFEQLIAYASCHGLLSEEVDPATGTALGNYPQAFSHIGLINSALTLTEALGER